MIRARCKCTRSHDRVTPVRYTTVMVYNSTRHHHGKLIARVRKTNGRGTAIEHDINTNAYKRGGIWLTRDARARVTEFRNFATDETSQKCDPVSDRHLKWAGKSVVCEE